MSKIQKLFNSEFSVINVGIDLFEKDFSAQSLDYKSVQFSPPANGDKELIDILTYLNTPSIREKIDAANQKAVEFITQSQPVLIGFDKAINVIPGMHEKMILHAGPPVEWKDMSGAMKGAVTGALVFEGLAKDIEEAERLAASGEIEFSPCHEHNTVGSMAGVTCPSMYVHIVENKTYGNVSYTNLSEQLAKILRMGANDQSVIDRLVWMRDVLGPMLKEAMELAGEIDLRLLLSQALHMGDECHNRNIAGTTLLLQSLSPFIAKTSFTNEQKAEVFEFIGCSDYFSGPTWMALAKNAMDAAHDIEYSSVVTTMCRNGFEFGIRVSGLGKENWYVGPSQRVIGPLFAGYTLEDSGLDIGDSAITETYGFGGFAMSAAPAIVSLVGGTVAEAIETTHKMYDITTTKNANVTIPILGFEGIPTGIDIIKVIEKNILPTINTAIAHKDAGVGMIGAGIVHPPYEAFRKAFIEFGEKIKALESK